MIEKNTQLKEILDIGKNCDKCNHCCSYGSGALAEDDLKNIAKFLKITEEKLKKDYLEEIEKFNTKRLRPKLIRNEKPYGKCVFLTKDGCKVHEVKPLECKIGNCKDHGEELSLWFMLNYYINPNDAESIRQFNAYLKSGGKTLKGGQLKDLVKEKELKNMLNYEDLKWNQDKL